MAQSLALLDELVASVPSKAVERAAGRLRREVLKDVRAQAQARVQAWRDQRMLDARRRQAGANAGEH